MSLILLESSSSFRSFAGYTPHYMIAFIMFPSNVPHGPLCLLWWFSILGHSNQTFQLVSLCSSLSQCWFSPFTSSSSSFSSSSSSFSFAVFVSLPHRHCSDGPVHFSIRPATFGYHIVFFVFLDNHSNALSRSGFVLLRRFSASVCSTFLKLNTTKTKELVFGGGRISHTPEPILIKKLK